MTRHATGVNRVGTEADCPLTAQAGFVLETLSFGQLRGLHFQVVSLGKVRRGLVFH